MNPYLWLHPDYLCQPNSKILLRKLLQFTCSKTIGLPSICGDPVEFTSSSLDTTSDSLTAGFVVPSTVYVIFQVSVEFSGVEVFRFLLDVPSLQAFSIRCQSNFFPPPPSPANLEYSWLSRLAPQRFIYNPALFMFFWGYVFITAASFSSRK
jgi:hypothetical protein